MSLEVPDRPYRTMRALVHAHYGRPAVVMGGGPSLPSELERCPSRNEAVYISACRHGVMLAGANYIVALDKIAEQIRSFGVPIVTRHMYGDFRLVTRMPPNSGIAAAWVARALGCAPIYTAGMDLGGAYFHDPHAKSGGSFTKEDHLRHWRGMMSQYPAEYSPVGGPLALEVPRWQVVRPGVVPRENLMAEVAGVFVTFTARRSHKGRWFGAHETAELPAREAQKLIRDGAARAAAIAA